MLKALLFDLDGTLVDTHQANFEAYQQALAKHQVFIEWSDFERTIGMQSGQFIPLLAPHLDDADISQVRHDKAMFYKDMASLTEPNIQLIDFLKMMAPHHKIGLVTTAQRQSADMILSYHGLVELFDVIVTANDVDRHKPDPQGYLAALKVLGVSADEAIAFEDSDSGIRAAEAAGLQVVAVKEQVV